MAAVTVTGREPAVTASAEVLVARGKSNAEIARELVVGAATVKTHVGRVLTKLGLRTASRRSSTPTRPA